MSSAAVTKMDAIMAGFTFTDPKIKEAATAFVENYRRSSANARAGLGHGVGMEVHDVSGGRGNTYEPGTISACRGDQPSPRRVPTRPSLSRRKA